MKAVVHVALAASVAWGLTVRPASAQATAAQDRTALDRYVAQPDPSYKDSAVKMTNEADYTWYVLEMTSQAWLTTNEVDRPLWKHWLTIVKPKTVTASTSSVHRRRRQRRSPPDVAEATWSSHIAVATKSVVAELKMVPNQPLIFAGETQGAQGGFADRLHVGQVSPHRRRKVAGPVADDQGRRARDGHRDGVSAPAPRAAGVKVEQFRRGRRFEAGLDDLDHGGGGQARGGDRAHRDRRAERRAVHGAPLRGLRFLGAGGRATTRP